MSILKSAIAKSTLTSGEKLRELSKDEDPSIRALVAANPKTPQDVLTGYAKDKNKTWAMIEGLMNNPSTPLKSLQELSLDIIRYAIENNAPDTPFLLKLIRIAKERGLEFSIDGLNNSPSKERRAEINQIKALMGQIDGREPQTTIFKDEDREL